MKLSTLLSPKLAFSRVELLVVLALLSMLLPVFAASLCKAWTLRAQSVCAARLKHVALASIQYADDYDNLPWRLPVAGGGTLEWVRTGEVVPHFQVLSNYISSPVMLLCSTERDRRPALHFDELRRRNLSYFAALGPSESCSEGRRRTPDRVHRIRESSRALLAGDRTLNGWVAEGRHARIFRPEIDLSWGPELHHGRGNVALTDGSVLLRPSWAVLAGILADSHPKGTLVVIP